MPDELSPGRRLSYAYSALLRGLLFPGSEADSPYEAFYADFDVGRELSTGTFRSVAGLRAGWWQLDLRSGDEWLDSLRASSADPAAGNDLLAAAAYGLLHKAMRATLEGRLHAVVAGARPEAGFHKTRHYVFGRVAGGGLAGVVTFSVET
jgi:hypothetical protein